MVASRSVSITYVPADCGSVIPGKSKAPQAFRDVSIVERLERVGLFVSEHHALDAPATYAASTLAQGRIRNEDLNVSVCKRVQSSLLENMKSSSSHDSFQLILGGECCMLPAIISAFWHHADAQSPPLRVGLVYIDADTDLSSPLSPDSTGILASMSMTHLIGGAGALPSMKEFSRPSGEPVCDASNTVFFGTNMAASGNKREHFEYLFDNKYRVVSSTSVARQPEERAAEALKYLEERVDVIMVHLDVDSIDPRMFPLANIPNYTGVTFEQMMRALKVFLASNKVGGLTIAEVNPDHDSELSMVDKLAGEIVGMLARTSTI